ncbi:MAG: D-glycero-beta-D-manno-heptose 1-phosphate adenylyltransferase [Candidatus Omnitrophota bacterium]|nr:D-glycero-beta-D-manno-heptose 1-phosphate adenylyltransferase [Candidatus Omnitrophota bacterium]
MKSADCKIVNINKLQRIVSGLRGKKKIIFTNGCFDILHRGHIQYLRKAKQLDGILIVGLNSDTSVRRIKGKARPIFNQKDRARLLSSLAFVDYVVIFNQDTPLSLINDLKPDVLIKGADWKGKEVVGADLVKSWKGKIRLIPYLKGYSTTGIISRIKQSCKK